MRDRRSLTALATHRTASGEQPVRVLLADDHALFRQALRMLLAREPGIEVVGEAGDGREAVRAAERLGPDVVVMDLVMPGLNGVDATRQIVKRFPDSRVLMLSAYLEDERLVQALRAGASGYLLKHAELDELMLAIHAVRRGNTYFGASVSEQCSIHDILVRAKRPERRGLYDRLTNREREVLQLIAEGRSNLEIADDLVISVKTVEAHRVHIMEKIGARNRTDLIRYALRAGLLGLEASDAGNQPVAV